MEYISSFDEALETPIGHIDIILGQILFDSENKIAGWVEKFHKHSEKEKNYVKYII